MACASIATRVRATSSSGAPAGGAKPTAVDESRPHREATSRAASSRLRKSS